MLYFALVDEGEVFDPGVHSREDLTVFDLTISHRETEFALVDLMIWNLRAPIPGRRIFISEDGKLLFDGEISSSPRGAMESIIEVSAVARPEDADEKLSALVESLKVKPSWDPLFVPTSAANDISEVLAGHGKMLAWSRTTGEVSAVDPLSGSNTLQVTPLMGSTEQDPESKSVGAASLTLEVQFRQLGRNEYQATSALSGFKSMTPERLIENWPTVGTSLGDGFRVSKSEISERLKFGANDREEVEAIRPLPMDELDPAWIQDNEIIERAEVADLDASLSVEHRFEVKRVERVEISLTSGVQELLRANEVEASEIKLNDITETADVAAWTPQVEFLAGQQIVEAGQVFSAKQDHFSGSARDEDMWALVGEASYLSSRRIPSFFKTARGQEAIAHGVERLKARLRFAARSVNVRCDFEMPTDLNDLNHDCMATISDPGLNGGSATGRVVYYELNWSRGSKTAHVEISCAAGTGEASTVTVGDPEGAVEAASGRVEFSLTGSGNSQKAAFLAGGDVPETVLEIKPTPAPSKDFRAELSVPISGVVEIPRQIELT